MQTRGMVVEAPAKVNLVLEVLAKRPDGYHDLRSVFVPISLMDTISLKVTEGEVVTEIVPDDLPGDTGQLIPDNGSNLATRAALLLKERTGCRMGARIHIVKRIPIGGGLAGGSTNAASVLIGLNTLWKTGLTISKMVEMSSSLGSDVPALVQGGAVAVTGKGDRIEPVLPVSGRKMGGWWLVLVNPGFGTSTGDIYSRYKGSLTTPASAYTNMLLAVAGGNLRAGVENVFNSLQGVVYRKYPLLEMMAEQLSRAGALSVLLCGSGASLFALARDEAHAREVEVAFKGGMRCNVWTKVVRTLPDGVMVAHGPLEA